MRYIGMPFLRAQIMHAVYWYIAGIFRKHEVYWYTGPPKWGILVWEGSTGLPWAQSMRVLAPTTMSVTFWRYTYSPHTVCHRSLGMGRYGGVFLLQGGDFQRFGNHWRLMPRGAYGIEMRIHRAMDWRIRFVCTWWLAPPQPPPADQVPRRSTSLRA